MTHRRLTSLELGRWRRGAALVPIGWNAKMAYAIGLLATDGCLVNGRKIVQFGSQDRDLVELLLDCLDRPARIREQRTRIGNRYFRTQFGDARFYEWLVTVGITPRKSLSLAAIDVPAEHVLSLVRGLLDGDGSIGNHVYRAERHGRPGYSWEYLCVSFSSSSEAHVRWLRQLLEANLAIHGSVGWTERRGRAPEFQLRYGKRASVVLLRAVYTDPRAPALSRKRAIWDAYVQRHCVGADTAG